MFNRLKNVRSVFLILFALEIGLLSLRYIVTKPLHWTVDVLIVLGNLLMIIWLFEYIEEQKRKRLLDISSVLGKSTQSAFLIGELGILTFNEDLEITWISELLENRSYQVVGQKVMHWLPETKALFNNELESVTVTINEHSYDVYRQEGSQTLILKDVTALNSALVASASKQIVLGLIHFDNYEETTQYEDEHRVSLIDSKIRQAVYRWASEMGIFIKRLRNNRMLLVLNEQILLKCHEDHFSILQTIRKEAEGLDVAITLSLAFARGSLEFSVLEEMVTGALALAQSRGGDQVAIKTADEDVIYLGGSSEAQEKRSKVRARVIAQSLREIVLNASNVIIMGHKEMDFDCFGSALAMSRFVSAYHKPVAVLMHGSLESKLSRAYKLHKEELSETHSFIAEHQVNALIDEKTVLILVDHHLANYSVLPRLLDEVEHIVVVDHHRRNQDFTFNPILVYTETAASSTSEMVTELIPYHQFAVNMNEMEATFILTGLVVDTNRFRNRTGSRTFEVASLLKQYGAESALCDGFLKDSLEDFQQKTQILKHQKRFAKGIMMAMPDDSLITSRSLISQCADTLLSIEGIEASFVVAKISERTIGVTARSNGNINVHAIMEKMQGSGHFTAAALQRENSTLESVVKELTQTIERWINEEGKV